MIVKRCMLAFSILSMTLSVMPVDAMNRGAKPQSAKKQKKLGKKKATQPEPSSPSPQPGSVSALVHVLGGSQDDAARALHQRMAGALNKSGQELIVFGTLKAAIENKAIDDDKARTKSFEQLLNGFPESMITSLLQTFVSNHSLLMHAAKNRSSGIVRLLINRGADPLAANGMGDDAFSVAGGEAVKDLLVVEVICKGRDVVVKALVTKAAEGNNAFLQRMMAQGISMKVFDDFSRDPLSVAIKKGHVSTVQLLWESGDFKEQEIVEECGMHPLITAWEVCGSLESGTSEEARRNTAEIIDYFMKQDMHADLVAQCIPQDNVILHVLLDSYRLAKGENVVSGVLEENEKEAESTEFNARINSNGDTFLIDVVQKLAEDTPWTVEFLLTQGSDPFIANNAGLTAFDYLKRQDGESIDGINHKKAIIRELISHCTIVSSPEKLDRLCKKAVCENHMLLLGELMKLEIPQQLKNEALLLAIEHCQIASVNLLLTHVRFDETESNGAHFIKRAVEVSIELGVQDNEHNNGRMTNHLQKVQVRAIALIVDMLCQRGANLELVEPYTGNESVPLTVRVNLTRGLVAWKEQQHNQEQEQKNQTNNKKSLAESFMERLIQCINDAGPANNVVDSAPSFEKFKKLVQLAQKQKIIDVMSGSDGQTLLMRAIDKGHVDMVRVLCQAGANIAIRDTKGKTAANYVQDGGILSIQEKMTILKLLAGKDDVPSVQPITQEQQECFTSVLQAADNAHSQSEGSCIESVQADLKRLKEQARKEAEKQQKAEREYQEDPKARQDSIQQAIQMAEEEQKRRVQEQDAANQENAQLELQDRHDAINKAIELVTEEQKRRAQEQDDAHYVNARLERDARHESILKAEKLAKQAQRESWLFKNIEREESALQEKATDEEETKEQEEQGSLSVRADRVARNDRVKHYMRVACSGVSEADFPTRIGDVLESAYRADEGQVADDMITLVDYWDTCRTQLLTAAREGNGSYVKELHNQFLINSALSLHKEVNRLRPLYSIINACDEQGSTPLLIAVMHGKFEFACSLLTYFRTEAIQALSQCNQGGNNVINVLFDLDKQDVRIDGNSSLQGPPYTRALKALLRNPAHQKMMNVENVLRLLFPESTYKSAYMVPNENGRCSYTGQKLWQLITQE